MTAAEIQAFVARHRLAVVATVAANGAPEAAVVGIAVTDRFEIVFDTLGPSRKGVNLRAEPRVALVIGWDEETVQLEGLADEPAGAELERVRAGYLSAFPDGVDRMAWPGITWVRVTPTWVRYSDFRGVDAHIIELGAAALARDRHA